MVVLTKPAKEQRTQRYCRKHVAHFPRGGEIVLFDRSWCNRAMVERVFGFCAEKEYEDFMEGMGCMVPDPEAMISGAREPELMEAERLRTGKSSFWGLAGIGIPPGRCAEELFSGQIQALNIGRETMGEKTKNGHSL